MLPRQHYKHLKNTNMFERLSEEGKRQTYIVRILPTADACLRLVGALVVETPELALREHKKSHLRQAA